MLARLEYRVGLHCISENSHVHWYFFRFKTWMDYSDFDTFFDRALDLSYAHYDRQLTLINRMVKELRPRCAASLGTCASGVPAFEPVCTTDDASVAAARDTVLRATGEPLGTERFVAALTG